MSHFPIYILEEETVLPEKGSCYIIAANGIFFRRDSGLVRGVAKCGEFPSKNGLAELREKEIKVQARLLNKEEMYRTLKFFQLVYNKHAGEADIVLYYNKEKNDYLLYCPEQEVSSAGVDYKQLATTQLEADGNYRIGTIHSHCNFGAYHSGIDLDDEKNFDGVHITLGDVIKDEFSIACSVLLNSNRVRVEPGTVAEGVALKPKHQKQFGFASWNESTQYATLDLTKEEEDALWEKYKYEILNEWMPKVSKKVFVFKKSTNYGLPKTYDDYYGGQYGFFF